MKQLSPLDSLFVFNERPHAPLHISPLMFYDVSTAPDQFVRFKQILATFEARLERAPIFRQRLLRLPGDLGYPYWVDDPHFDLEFHVRHIALPRPGDWRQFCILIARLHARPLDLSRPPWEAYIIEGLDGIPGLPRGSFAMYLKIHHAAIDGASGNQIVESLHDSSPQPGRLPAPAPWRPAPLPARAALGLDALAGARRHPGQALELLRHLMQARSRIRVGFEGQEYASHEVAEQIRFNAAVTPHRVFGGLQFELERVKAIKRAVAGSTLNDVVLAVIGGALRRYLAIQGELPRESLVAAVPVSTRRPEERDSGGNQVSGMRLYLRTDVADPVQRVRLIHADGVQSKAYQHAVDARGLTDLGGFLPAGLLSLGMRIATATGLNRRRPLFHTIVTNVPGPRQPLYMGGARMVWWFGAGALFDGMGLFHTVTSYCDTLALSYLSCRQQLPDPQVYDDCLRQAFAELETAARAQPGAAGDWALAG